MASAVQWRRLWTRLGVGAPDESVFHALISRYSEPHRKYHTTRHLDECFDKLEELRMTASHPDEIELALWFHDAIYDVTRQDNEQKSADWARAAIVEAGLSASIAERVHALVMVTRHNAAPATIDENILVDVDLSILGAEPDRFDEYEKQIREEYSWVPEILFRSRRREILKAFLDRPSIYSTRVFVEAYESQARENLERSIKTLKG